MKFSTNVKENKRLKLMYQLCVYLALVPPYENDKLIFYQIYSTSVAIILSSAFIFSNYMFNSVKQNYVFATNLVIHVIFSTSRIVYLNVLILNGAILRVKYLRELLKSIEKVNGLKVTIKYQTVWFLIILINFCALCLAASFAILHLLRKPALHVLLYTVGSTYSFYLNANSILLISNLILMLKNKFKSINGTLNNLFKFPKMVYVTHSTRANLDLTVKRLRRDFNNLSKSVQLFNKVYGWQILFLTLCIILSLLSEISFTIVKVNKSNVDYVAMTLLYFLKLVWNVSLLVTGVSVAVTCDMTTKEAKRTGTICYNLLLDLPAVSDNAQDHILREEIILLAQQATNQYPRFSAAGFFNVDYTMIIAIFGTITTYAIVLIQINK